ncbi:hypothetical protein ABB27_16325 [Stenotrophomonas terrae]|uniref:GtrA/DPMS transmembrane domain-containing protein n=1 Tax=Stenotrophomonas terrae TaxID=405446 RepID=A0A0R0C4C3_9GAMM|nr:GtrA family protein [Stenotrophomonas terrae]KRG64621.1 hypothetical protein ABB27_16325 [Stenotrophomonas terrae]
MFASTKLTINYAIFALIAMAANIGAQHLVIQCYSGSFDIMASIIVGTGVGLVVKYVLDKRYIFQFHPRNAIHDMRTFLLYTAMGGVTTLVFWAFEFGFQHVFQTSAMRYLGGVLGLTIGYLAKYHLDKHYVFRLDPA